MPNAIKTANNSPKSQLEQALAQAQVGPPGLRDAVQGLIAALEYRDPTLFSSAAVSAFEYSHNLVSEYMRAQLGFTPKLKETVRSNWGLSEPCEDMDEAGRLLDSKIASTLEDWAGAKRIAELLRSQGYAVDVADAFAQEIADLQEFRRNVLENWPWSSIEIPVDREMVARSTAAIARGEGEPIEDLIRRLGA